MTKWISVKDKLPEASEALLVFCERYDEVRIATFNGTWWEDHQGYIYELEDDYFTHWTPLPELPKQ